MDLAGSGKPGNSSFSFRYNPNNEELEELHDISEEDKQPSQTHSVETCTSGSSPKKVEKTPSLIDKYFKSMKSEKSVDKIDDSNDKSEEKYRNSSKEITASPVKEYLNRFGKKTTSTYHNQETVPENSNETWRIFHDLKFKIAQAVDDIKTRSNEDSKDKLVTRESSVSDSEENSATKDVDQQSMGDTDNQVSSLDSSLQNLSELTPCAVTTKQNAESPVERDSPESDDTHKNFDTDLPVDQLYTNVNNIEIESGVDALEYTNIDHPEQLHSTPQKTPRPQRKQKQTKPTDASHRERKPSKHAIPSPDIYKPNPKCYFLNFIMYFITFILFLNLFLFPNSPKWNGFLLGVWSLYTMNAVKTWAMDNYLGEWEPERRSYYQIKRTFATPFTFPIPTIKEHTPSKKYEGWVNKYRYPSYNPFTYTLYKTTTVFMKLEGSDLKISYTKTHIPKRHVWDEKLEPVSFYQHRMYSLVGAKIVLLPDGLVRRRHWSKKYPLGIVLSEQEKVIVLEKEVILKEFQSPDKKKEFVHVESESTETSSPEKKKKFIWRKKEKSVSHSDGESGKEGLRHRFVRKIHREKKTEHTATELEATDQPAAADKSPVTDEPVFHDAEMESSSSNGKDEVTEEDMDERDIARIKDFIEEAEAEAAPNVDGNEFEWTVHIKTFKTKQRLFIVPRTGREKYEWYRRINNAISECKKAPEPAERKEERSGEEKDERDSPDTAVYKPKDEKSLSFSKSPVKNDIVTEKPCEPNSESLEASEKTFWSYMFRIMKVHEMNVKMTNETGVMCQLEPSPPDKSKHKKKKKTKSEGGECPCRLLPPEISWLNMVVARIAYDVMTDPQINRRLHIKVQKKLNTLKLPSFMSPLVVEKLSLSGACPLLERISPPMTDERGVWLEADLRYEGGGYISLLTQINLLNLKEKNTTLEDRILEAETTQKHNLDRESIKGFDLSDMCLRSQKPAIYDSDEEDSAESSGAEDNLSMQTIDGVENVGIPLDTVSPSTTSDTVTSSKKKFLKMVDRLATNKYFQQVTDYKYIKRAMEGLSNTDIKVHVTLEALEGRLVINLPPPPHDRMWLGFRSNPQLILKAKPAFGARSLNFAHISNWIEERLIREFEKIVVMPNMEDFIIDGMTPTPCEFE